ncbi:MAG: hypothetical protein WC548_00895 [Candidatus Pacearchaeota archaeon]
MGYGSKYFGRFAKVTNCIGKGLMYFEKSLEKLVLNPEIINQLNEVSTVSERNKVLYVAFGVNSPSPFG